MIQVSLHSDIARVGQERETLRGKVTGLLTDVGEHYQTNRKATYELHQGHDVHAFYRLAADPSKVVHMQGYPGMSIDEYARVCAWLLDHNRMMEIRSGGDVSIGNEHAAIIANFPQFPYAVEVPYDPAVLRAKLEESVPELR